MGGFRDFLRMLLGWWSSPAAAVSPPTHVGTWAVPTHAAEWSAVAHTARWAVPSHTGTWGT